MGTRDAAGEGWGYSSPRVWSLGLQLPLAPLLLQPFSHAFSGIKQTRKVTWLGLFVPGEDSYLSGKPTYRAESRSAYPHGFKIKAVFVHTLLIELSQTSRTFAVMWTAVNPEVQKLSRSRKPKMEIPVEICKHDAS